MILPTSASDNYATTIIIDLMAYSLTTVSSKPASYSNTGRRMTDYACIIVLFIKLNFFLTPHAQALQP